MNRWWRFLSLGVSRFGALLILLGFELVSFGNEWTGFCGVRGSLADNARHGAV
jgi:hypothetical protein